MMDLSRENVGTVPHTGGDRHQESGSEGAAVNARINLRSRPAAGATPPPGSPDSFEVETASEKANQTDHDQVDRDDIVQHPGRN